LVIQFQNGQAEVVAELTPDELFWDIGLAALRASLYQRDALIVVHNMECFALQRHADSAAVIHAIKLETAKVVRSLLRVPFFRSVTLRTRWPPAS
jgi:hypothetical protein